MTAGSAPLSWRTLGLAPAPVSADLSGKTLDPFETGWPARFRRWGQGAGDQWPLVRLEHRQVRLRPHIAACEMGRTVRKGQAAAAQLTIADRQSVLIASAAELLLEYFGRGKGGFPSRSPGLARAHHGNREAEVAYLDRLTKKKQVAGT